MMKNSFVIVFFLILLLPINPLNSLDQREELFNEALTLSSSGRFDLALENWDNYLEKFPDDAAALSNRGNVKLVSGDPFGAIKDQEKAIKLGPEELDPYINRGIAKESLGLWLEAKDDYLFVLSKDDINSAALYNLGNVEGSLNNWDKARDLFNNAAQSNPGFAMARSSFALAEYELGNISKSEKELRKLIRKYPTFVDARAALTALTWEKGKLGEAESNWVAVLELDPRYLQEDWLLDVRRWPPSPVNDLMRFLSLK